VFNIMKSVVEVSCLLNSVHLAFVIASELVVTAFLVPTFQRAGPGRSASDSCIRK
jgi:hypothetical protein